jgi:hypothetical protein
VGLSGQYGYDATPFVILWVAFPGGGINMYELRQTCITTMGRVPSPTACIGYPETPCYSSAPRQLDSPAIEPICKKYLELRYQMMPHFYSAVKVSWETARTRLQNDRKWKDMVVRMRGEKTALPPAAPD